MHGVAAFFGIGAVASPAPGVLLRAEEAPADTGPRIANIKDFGAIGDGMSHPLSGRFPTLAAARAAYAHVTSLSDEIDWAATQKAINSLTRGGVVYLPTGTYRLNRTLRIATDGVTMQGDGAHTAKSIGYKPTALNFSTLPSGTDAIVAVGMDRGTSLKGVKFRSFYLEMLPEGVGGVGIKCLNCSGIDVQDVAVYAARGHRSAGIQFGNREGVDGSDAVIASSIRGCTVVSDGTPIFVGPGSTSISIEHSYVLGAYTAGITFARATYCAVTACAADTGQSIASGYRVEGSTGIVFSACGAENNGRSFLSIAGGSSGITVISSRGVGNNTAGAADIGSFVDIADPGTFNVQLIGCTDTRPHDGTTASIRAASGTREMSIMGYTAAAFPDGIRGAPRWREEFLTVISGDAVETPNLRVTGQLVARHGAVLADAILSRGATTGFVGIPGSAGPPSGTPDSAFGRSFPMVYDHVNNQLYIWNGSWRRTSILT